MKYALCLTCLLLAPGCMAKERMPRRADIRDELSMARLVAGGVLGMCAAGCENVITASIANDKESRLYVSFAVAAAIEALKYKMPYQMPADMQRGFYGINGIANAACGFSSDNRSLGWGAITAHIGGAALSYCTISRISYGGVMKMVTGTEKLSSDIARDNT